MGTDTMAYAASAVSFMFQNLGKPVIFTVRQAKVGLAQVFCSTFMISLQHKPLSSNLFLISLHTGFPNSLARTVQ